MVGECGSLPTGYCPVTSEILIPCAGQKNGEPVQCTLDYFLLNFTREKRKIVLCRGDPGGDRLNLGLDNFDPAGRVYGLNRFEEIPGDLP
jgi:hypothetical protein